MCKFVGSIHWAVLRRSANKEETVLEGMPKEYYDDVCVSLVSVSLVFIIIIMVWQHDDAGERVTKMVLYSLLQQIFFFCAFCSTNQP